MLFGHVAVSVLQHRYLKADLKQVVVAGVFPDVVDKALCHTVHLTPSGRMLGHTLLALSISTLAVRWIWGQRAARSWALGYLGHLIGDLGDFLPWLYPFVQYNFPQRVPTLFEILRRALADPIKIGLDVALSVWVVVEMISNR